MGAKKMVTSWLMNRLRVKRGGGAGGCCRCCYMTSTPDGEGKWEIDYYSTFPCSCHGEDGVCRCGGVPRARRQGI